MSLAYQILESSRAHLNDEMGLLWPDQKLLPKLQEAHRDLKLQLELNGIPIVHQVSAVLSVPANTTDLTTVTGYPTDLLLPIWLKERQVGQTNDDFIDMTPRDFLPNVNKDPLRLFWWCWIGQKITLVGSLGAIEVELRYDKDLTVPIQVNSDIGILMSDSYLSYRTAELVAASIKDYKMAEYLNVQAEKSLDQLIRFNVKNLQMLPARRRPYHRRFSNNTIIRGI